MSDFFCIEHQWSGEYACPQCQVEKEKDNCPVCKMPYHHKEKSPKGNTMYMHKRDDNPYIPGLQSFEGCVDRSGNDR